MERGQIIEITWIDAQQDYEWEDINDLNLKELCEFVTVGYFIKEGENYIAVSQSFDKDILKKNKGILIQAQVWV